MFFSLVPCQSSHSAIVHACFPPCFYLFVGLFISWVRVHKGSGCSLSIGLLGHVTQTWVGGAGRQLPEPLQNLASYWSAALRQGTTQTHTHFTYGECFTYQQRVSVWFLSGSCKHFLLPFGIFLYLLICCFHILYLMNISARCPYLSQMFMLIAAAVFICSASGLNTWGLCYFIVIDYVGTEVITHSSVAVYTWKLIHN